MKKTLAVIALLGCLLAGSVQAAVPKGWFVTGSAAANYDIGAEPGSRHPGDSNAFIRSKKDGAGFGSLMQTISANGYRGKRIRLSGLLRTKDANKAGLWMRIDSADKRGVGFDNMDSRALRGDHDWQSYSIVLDVPPDAIYIAYGFLLDGKGEVLADDFKLETVDSHVPTTGMPRPQFPSAPVNMDFMP